jgi:hypothetical protein
MGRTTPSYLKGLRDNRARADGDVARLTSIIERATLALQAALAARDSCDNLIRRVDPGLDPKKIKPNRGPGRIPGPRGTMRTAIVNYLKERAPDAVPSTEVFVVLEAQFGLEFSSAREREVWHQGSVKKQLKRLSYEGLVERLHDPNHFTGEVGRWRWNAENDPSADHLRAQAEAAGVAVRESDGDPD